MSSNMINEKGGLEYLTSQPDSTNSPFESLFDFTFEPFQNSYGNTPGEPSDLFDELDSISPSKDVTSFDLSSSVPLSATHKENHSWREQSWRHQTMDTIRTTHKLRKDDQAISNTDLLKLEGKAPKAPVTLPSAVKPTLLPSQPIGQMPPFSPSKRPIRKIQAKGHQDKWRSSEDRAPTMHQSNHYHYTQHHSSGTSSLSRQSSKRDPGLTLFPLRTNEVMGAEPGQWQAIEAKKSLPLTTPPIMNLDQLPSSNAYSINPESYLNSPFSNSSPEWDQKVSQESHFPSRQWGSDPLVDRSIYEQGNFNSSQHVHTQSLSDPTNALGIHCSPLNELYTGMEAFIESSHTNIVRLEEEVSESSDCSPSVPQLQSFSHQSDSTSPSISPTEPLNKRHTPRSCKASKSTRRSRTPKTSKASPASGGFVNFTPDDSQRILTGVAPSGSSKTKARREREASEKRKKLGEAAARAVLKGDISELYRDGLLLESGQS